MDAVRRERNSWASADTRKVTGLAFVHGYHVSFFWGAVLLFSALLVTLLLINAKKDDIPAAEEAMAA